MLCPSADGKPTIKSAELLALDRQLDGALSDIVSIFAFAGKKVPSGGRWLALLPFAPGPPAGRPLPRPPPPPVS
jgi:hypothetical protein